MCYPFWLWSTLFPILLGKATGPQGLNACQEHISYLISLMFCIRSCCCCCCCCCNFSQAFTQHGIHRVVGKLSNSSSFPPGPSKPATTNIFSIFSIFRPDSKPYRHPLTSHTRGTAWEYTQKCYALTGKVLHARNGLITRLTVVSWVDQKKDSMSVRSPYGPDLNHADIVSLLWS